MKEIFSPVALDGAYLGPDGVIPDGLSTSLGRTKGFLFGGGQAGYQATHLFSWLWETFLGGLSLGIPSIPIQLIDDEALSSIDLPNSMMYFTKEQFVVGLHLPIHSLFKQFLHFTQIPPAFLHPNVVQVLMGCSVLDMLFQLDLSLLEVLFTYTVKMNQKESFLHPQQAVRDRLYTSCEGFPFYEVARLQSPKPYAAEAHFFVGGSNEIMRTYVVHNIDENEDLLASLETTKSEVVAAEILLTMNEEKKLWRLTRRSLRRGCPDEAGVVGSPWVCHSKGRLKGKLPKAVDDISMAWPDTPSFLSDDEEAFLGCPT
ncbi:hypothetical protein AAG906_017243 [Vitis piasezkii]